MPGLAIRCFSRKRPALPGGVGAGAEIGAAFCNVDEMRDVCGVEKAERERTLSAGCRYCILTEYVNFVVRRAKGRWTLNFAKGRVVAGGCRSPCLACPIRRIRLRRWTRKWHRIRTRALLEALWKQNVAKLMMD